MNKIQERAEDYEIEMRGITLNISTKFETGLMQIIYFSHAQQYIKPEDAPSLKIKNLTFGGKLKRAKELLSEFHPDLIVKYQNVFNSLDEFLVIRNRMAHCSMHWLDDKLQNLELWDVSEDRNKLQFYSPVHYTRHGIADMLLQFTNEIGNPLLALAMEVQNRFQFAAPKLFAAITGASDEDQGL